MLAAKLLCARFTAASYRSPASDMTLLTPQSQRSPYCSQVSSAHYRDHECEHDSRIFSYSARADPQVLSYSARAGPSILSYSARADSRIFSYSAHADSSIFSYSARAGPQILHISLTPSSLPLAQPTLSRWPARGKHRTVTVGSRNGNAVQLIWTVRDTGNARSVHQHRSQQ